MKSILRKFVLNLNYGILKARTYGIYLDFEVQDEIIVQ